MKTIARQMYLWGPKGVSVFALLVACFALFLVYTRPIPELIPATTSTNVVPATGEEGFNVAVFCDDKLTSVRATIAPDASGVTYELRRVKNNVTETVTIVLAQTGDILYAKHFSDGPAGQESGAAFVTDQAKQCITRKG